MTEREKYDIAVRAKMCGGRRGDIVTLNDGSRWKLVGLTITPAPDDSIPATYIHDHPPG